MNIKIITKLTDLNEQNYKYLSQDFVIVVIDVLRATSTIVTALYSKALSVVPVTTVEEAENVKEKLHLENSLLCGEENSEKIPGFDLGNSPLLYSRETVEDKIIILKTTNGTQALRKCYKIFPDKQILIASLLNVIFVAQKLKNINKDILIICSGENGEYSLEDFACAGLILDLIDEYDADDLTKTAAYVVNYFNKDYLHLLTESAHGKELIEKGFHEDLKFCSEIGIYNIAPEYKEGAIYKY